MQFDLSKMTVEEKIELIQKVWLSICIDLQKDEELDKRYRMDLQKLYEEMQEILEKLN